MKKRKILLALALAGVCALGLTSCGGGNANTTSGNTVFTTNLEGDPIVEGEYKYYVTDVSSSQAILFGVKKLDNKLSEIALFGGGAMGYLVPDYKDNRIVGIKIETTDGQMGQNYFTVGDNFVNNIGNALLLSTKDNNLVLSYYGKEIKIGFDGSSSSENMQEIDIKNEISFGNYTFKRVNNSFEASATGGAKIKFTRTESGMVLEQCNSAGEVQYKIVKERKENFENYMMYYATDTKPLSLQMVYRYTYDSNNRIIKSNGYYVSQYGFYPEGDKKYYYNDKGLVSSIQGQYSEETADYDSYGRLICANNDYQEERYEYNDKGLRSSYVEINKESYYGPSQKTVYEYDSNNRISKETYYAFDSETNTFANTATSTKTYAYNDNGFVATNIYPDGSKEIITSESSLTKSIRTTAKYNSTNQLTEFSGEEMSYDNARVTSDIRWTAYNGEKVKKEETIYSYGENSRTEEHYSYDASNGSIDDFETNKIVYTLNNDSVVKAEKFNYDATAKAFKTEAASSAILTRDNENNITKVEEIDFNLDKNVSEYTYTNGELTKITLSSLDYNESTKSYDFGGKTEQIISNDLITDYKEFNEDGSVSLDCVYNELCDKVTERYYYYDDKGELTGDTYGYDYTYNDYGEKIIYKCVVYYTPIKNYIVSSQRTYTYENHNLIKETNKSGQETITLDNTYNSNNKISTQIRKTYNGETVTDQIKYVQDYDKSTTTIYEFVNGEWKESSTKNSIEYLNASFYK